MARHLLDLALGRACLSCRLPGPVWCDRCLRRVVQVRALSTPGGRSVLAAARYEGEVREALIAHKERGQLSLAGPLGRLLGAAVGRGEHATLIPVPSTRAAVRARGHDHARRLARACGSAIGASVVPGLSWSRAVDDQAGLGVADRRRNVASAMTLVRRLSTSAPIWVVDDVLTSGATLDEAARALTVAGCPPTGMAVVAAVEARMALAPLRPLR